MALSRSPLPRAVFDAISSSPEEAEARVYADKRKRSMAVARSLVGW